MDNHNLRQILSRISLSIGICVKICYRIACISLVLDLKFATLSCPFTRRIKSQTRYLFKQKFTSIYLRYTLFFKTHNLSHQLLG